MEPDREDVVVYGQGGLRGTATLDEPKRGQVHVHLDQGGEWVLPADALAARDDGAYELRWNREQLAAFRQAGAAGEGGEPAVIPVVEERLEVDKRRVETSKTSVHKRVREHEEVVDLPLIEEEVDVERVPVNRFVEGPLAVRQEGDVTIIPVIEEVVVVEKRFLLKEEVRVVRRRQEKRYQQAYALRREEVEIERTPLEPGAPPR